MWHFITSKTLQILVLCMSISSMCFANVSMVVLSFDDNTPYKSWHTAGVMEEFMLSDIMNFHEFDLMERSTVKEAVIAEQSLNGTSGDNIVGSDDFDAIYDGVAGQACLQRIGEKVNPDKTKYLGEAHHAKYLLHGSIDYLGTGESSFMSPLPAYDFSYKAPYLDAVVTIRLIKADTGEVIWLTQQRGASKESLWKYKGVAIGSDELNNQLFVEALEKISKKVMKQMSEDMKKGVLKF